MSHFIKGKRHTHTHTYIIYILLLRKKTYIHTFTPKDMFQPTEVWIYILTLTGFNPISEVKSGI